MMGVPGRTVGLVLLCATLFAGVVQATRPGPMLRGGTLIVVQRGSGDSHGRSSVFDDDLPGSFPGGFGGSGDGGWAPALESGRLFRGVSLFQPLQMWPSTLLHESSDPLAELFGPPRRRPCPHAAAAANAGPEAMLRHMAAARFGPELLSSLLAASQVGDEEAAFGEQPMSQVAIATPRILSAGRGHGQSFSHTREENEATSQHARDTQWGLAAAASDTAPRTLPGASWRFQDFANRQGAAAALSREATTPESAARPARQAPALSWDVYTADGQLNGGVLVFVLLCIACVVVWARLLVLWCTFRTASCFRAGARRAARFAKGRNPIKDGLEEPLLNPLAPEAPITAAQAYRVEVAASHTLNPRSGAPPFVTLQYVPLRSEL